MHLETARRDGVVTELYYKNRIRTLDDNAYSSLPSMYVDGLDDNVTVYAKRLSAPRYMSRDEHESKKKTEIGIMRRERMERFKALVVEVRREKDPEFKKIERMLESARKLRPEGARPGQIIFEDIPSSDTKPVFTDAPAKEDIGERISVSHLIHKTARTLTREKEDDGAPSKAPVTVEKKEASEGAVVEADL